MAGVAGPTTWGGLAGDARQHASGEHYEQSTSNGGCTGFNTARVTISTCEVTRQTISAWVDVRLTGLYPSARSFEQDSGIAKVMHPPYPGQHHHSRRLAVSRSPPMDVGTDPVHMSS